MINVKFTFYTGSLYNIYNNHKQDPDFSEEQWDDCLSYLTNVGLKMPYIPQVGYLVNFDLFEDVNDNLYYLSNALRADFVVKTIQMQPDGILLWLDISNLTLQSEPQD